MELIVILVMTLVGVITFLCIVFYFMDYIMHPRKK